MSARETGEVAVSPDSASADLSSAPSTRPSWEAAAPAPKMAEAPRPYYAAAPPPLRPPPPVSTPPPPDAPVYQEESIKYDLAGNPIASAMPLPAAYAPPPIAANTGSWPPPVAANAPGGFHNTSGEGGAVPPEVARLNWNWGAFFFPVMWCRKHGLAMEANVLRYSFLALVLIRMVLHGVSPLAFIALGAVYGTAYSGARVYFAFKGHQMGWRSRHFPGGVPEYFQVQKAWMWWGFGVSAVWLVILPVIFSLGMVGAVLSQSHSRSYNSPYGGHYSGYANPSGGGTAAPTSPGGN